VPGTVKSASPDAPTQAHGQGAPNRSTGGNGRQAENVQGASQGQPPQPGQQEQPQIEVPEQPKLADDITLKGEMQESAFVEPPWLLERDGGYIQLPKLLYHVAEQCTGDQTHEQMAEAVGEKLGRTITADNIKTLVAKLIPMGIVEVPGLSEAARKRGSSAAGALSVNAKMLKVPPRVITPLSHILQVFYIKPVLVLTLLLTFAAEGWMFFVHGLGGGIHDALYTPGLLIAVFGLVIVATAFHEFGHASALQHGGGKVGEMGAGIYIVYPAFYTDVTDNYRLARWARVRTDLGGIYFSLIFSVVLMALYVATDSAFLLMVVLFINIEIFHNLLPFVRLDGYWTLADITGIPDFFSMLAPYCRSHVPFKWLPLPKGRTCPELKPWAKWVFGIYIIITVPLLAFLLIMMVLGVPRILATFVDAAWQQVGNISRAWDAGDFLGVAAAGGQMLLLALPTFALVFTLFNLGKRLVVGLWNWGKKSPRNGVIAGLGSVAAVLLLLFLWSPSLLLSFFVKGGVPERGPLQDLVQFRPIDKQERLTVGDIVTGQVVTVTRRSGLAMFGLDFGPPSSPITATVTTTATLTASARQTITVTGTPRLGGSATALSGTPRASTPTPLTTIITATATPATATATATAIVTGTAASGLPVASVAPATTGTAQPSATSPVGSVGSAGTATAAAQATSGAAQPTSTTSGSQPTTAPAVATPTTGSASGPTVPPGSTPTAIGGSGSTPVPPAPTAATLPSATPAVVQPAPTSTPVPASTPLPADTPVVQPTSPPPADTPEPLPTSTPTPTPTATPTPTSTPTSTPAPLVPTSAPAIVATATSTTIVSQDATTATNTAPTATPTP
jgi:putative peptide zinc metalloprotease protein